MSKIVASIEARMGASRLPGKVLADLGGKPALTRMLDRVRQARLIDEVIVATSVAAGDDAIVLWAQRQGIAVHRGSEDNVLQRVLEAHRAMRTDVVVKLCGDCPVINSYIIDQAIERFQAGDVDFVTTTAPQSYPQGLDVEVFALASLEEVAAHCDDAEVREHVTSDFYRNRSRWRLKSLSAPPALNRPDLRLLLDWPEDLCMLQRLYARLDILYDDRFDTADVLALLDREPDILGLAPASRSRAD